MRILLKILCAPMIAVLSVFVWLASKLVQISAVVMNFIAIAAYAASPDHLDRRN